jgi:hypothetical protein
LIHGFASHVKVVGTDCVRAEDALSKPMLDVATARTRAPAAQIRPTLRGVRGNMFGDSPNKFRNLQHLARGGLDSTRFGAGLVSRRWLPGI